MELADFIFLTALLLLAFLYSSVGHGGASGYLALMGLFHFTPDEMRPSALILNVFVSAIAAYQFSKSETLNRKLFIWLILGSIPAAYLGAAITLDPVIYKRILGGILLFQALRLVGVIKFGKSIDVQIKLVTVFIIGLLIGFLSGIIGIGGGIILSPLLLLFGWASMKQTAYISALFIFLNSISGLLGLVHTNISFTPVLYLWVAVALAGGAIGSWMGSKHISPQNLTKVLGIVLIVAAFKLMIF